MYHNEDFPSLIRQIKERMFWVPEYFYAKHPAHRAPMRFLVNRKSRAKRSRLGDELRSRGFVVRYWRPNVQPGVL